MSWEATIRNWPSLTLKGTRHEYWRQVLPQPYSNVPEPTPRSPW